MCIADSPGSKKGYTTICSGAPLRCGAPLSPPQLTGLANWPWPGGGKPVGSRRAGEAESSEGETNE